MPLMPTFSSASGTTAAQVRVQRDRILASKAFSLSKRQCAFLDYVINEALEGRSDKLNEFAVAIMVFGRDESFDPRVDSIVRVEAIRLRAKLREYYVVEGQVIQYGSKSRRDITSRYFARPMFPN